MEPTNPVNWPMTDEEIAAGAERAMSEGLLQKWRAHYAELLEQAKKLRDMKKLSADSTDVGEQSAK